MAKTIRYIAFLDNDTLIDNLSQCIKILGGDPIVSNNTVKVVAPYPSELANKLTLLYEHYWRHEITVSDK